MKELIIKYRTVEGKITKRHITNIRLNGADKISAFCHLRNTDMGFMISGIIEAILPSSGEFIENIYTFLDLEIPVDFNNPLQYELMPPEFIPGKSQEFYKGQRRKEKT
ncbi:hypothetical protein JWG44_08520, partial [Leptospira sp. 201903071]|uniref:hypothetical protein n=1 Tax=Leptospira ainazelensis TaxID=2810034 RepID=UPI001964D4E3